MTEPRKALIEAGATTTIVSTKPGTVRGMKHDEKADEFPVEAVINEVSADAYDAVMLPGGVINADQLRMVPPAQALVQKMQVGNKPIAVICHAPWLLVSAGLVRGRTLTSWPTLQDDIRNAGGRWVDREVVREGNLVSSRKPDDIPAFNREMIALFAEHAPVAARGTKQNSRG